MTKVRDFIGSIQRSFRLPAFRLWVVGACLLILGGGCGVPFVDEKAPDSLRVACGKLCLQNGENCSQFFARKSEEKRLFFEQAKSNYWMCLKRYQGEQGELPIPCVPPGPSPEQFDHCGTDLDACLESCAITLEELDRLARTPAPILPEPETGNSEP